MYVCPQGTNISHTQERGGDKHFPHTQGGLTFLRQEEDKHFKLKAVVSMIMLMKK